MRTECPLPLNKDNDVPDKEQKMYSGICGEYDNEFQVLTNRLGCLSRALNKAKDTLDYWQEQCRLSSMDARSGANYWNCQFTLPEQQILCFCHLGTKTSIFFILIYFTTGLMNSAQRSALFHMKSFFQDQGGTSMTQRVLLKRIHCLLPCVTFATLCSYDDW